MITFDLKRVLRREGYRCLRELPTGEIAGVLDQMYTTGLFVGLDEYTWNRRYCYEHKQDAVDALKQWDGKGDPLGDWIVLKPEGRMGPGAIK